MVAAVIIEVQTIDQRRLLVEAVASYRILSVKEGHARRGRARCPPRGPAWVSQE